MTNLPHITLYNIVTYTRTINYITPAVTHSPSPQAYSIVWTTANHNTQLLLK